MIYITGSTKGIGYGVAELLLKSGYKVAISGRNEKDVQKIALELSRISMDVIGVVSDVRDYEKEQQAIKAILEKFGRIDVVLPTQVLESLSR